MQPELALQKLNEVREVVDGETAELVDALAKMVMLQRDLSHPMLGAKVTLHQRPPTEESTKIDEELVPDDWEDDWQYYPLYSDESEGKVGFNPKQNEDDPEMLHHEAIVIEGNVAGDAPEGELWDPNDQEYREAHEYPFGTVNVVVAQEYNGDELLSFTDNYATDVRVFTSITPVDGDPKGADYTPGWGYEEDES
jgi:hypothetical protein